MPTEHPSLTVPDAASWSTWLAREADTSNGVILTIARTGHTKPTSLTYEDARDEALCHGWIDSTGRGVDDTCRVVRFTPRRARSVWSKHNINHVARLEDAGRMRARGWDEVNKAKADGRWDAAYCQASNEPPADLLAAIAANPAAQAQWDILTKSNRFAICFRLAALKNAANRPGRIQRDVEMLARGETVHPQKRKLGDDGDDRKVLKPKLMKAERRKPMTKPKKAKDTVLAIPGEKAESTSVGRRSARLRRSQGNG